MRGFSFSLRVLISRELDNTLSDLFHHIPASCGPTVKLLIPTAQVELGGKV